MTDDAADPLAPLKACELHVHMGGCFSVDDLIDLTALTALTAQQQNRGEP